jgi:hypothetical protein
MTPQRLVGPDDVSGHPSGAGNAAALHWILRVGVAACFAAQGASEMIAHRAWAPYFAAGGNPEPWAWQHVPVTGAMAIAIAVLTLVRPVPALLLWAAAWGLHVRLLSGDRAWESLERAGAFGIPLVLMWSAGWPRSLGQWFSPVRPAPLGAPRVQQVSRILGVTTAALLIGHGWFGVFAHKAEWSGSFATMGLGPGIAGRLSLMEASGWFEIGLGLAILAWPWPGVLLVGCGWMLGTAWLRPLAGEPVWESLEGGWSYAAPLALLWLRVSIADPRERSRARALEHRLRLQALLGIAPGGALAGSLADHDHAEVLDLHRRAGHVAVPARWSPPVQDETPIAVRK